MVAEVEEVGPSIDIRDHNSNLILISNLKILFKLTDGKTTEKYSCFLVDN